MYCILHSQLWISDYSEGRIMKKVINKKAFDNKKVYGKGKIFRSCYFENCIIKRDRHSLFYDCYVTKNGKAVLI